MEAGNKEPEQKMKQHKRQWRELTDQQRQYLSQATRGRAKSETHKQHIAQSMKDYWADVPHRPSEESGHTTMDDFLGI